jgi:lipid II:glycine glycyltransferase (peptidoglycan interpeptide bridge formation enzyme)
MTTNLTFTSITDRDQWNTYLRQMPYAHILQTWEWGVFKYETTGWIPHRWAWMDGQTPVALCSMGERKIGPFSMMYAPKGPALHYDDPALAAAILEMIQEKARQHRAIWVKVDPDVTLASGVPGEESDQPNPIGQRIEALLTATGWLFSDDQIQFRNTITIDLTRSEEDILMAMSQNTRRKVRQAEKKEVTIRSGTVADLDALYDLYTTTGERNEFLVRPRSYYTKLWRYFLESNLAHILIAEHEARPIAHVILFHFGATCWYFYGASSNEERDRMPNYALQWEAMRWAKAHGYSTYDMWGAPNEFIESDSMWGVYMFKQGFRGTVERRIGAWDYAPYPLLYRLYSQAVPRLRDGLRRLRR